MRSRARGGKRYRNRTMRGGKFNPLKTALTAQAAIPQFTATDGIATPRRWKADSTRR